METPTISKSEKSEHEIQIDHVDNSAMIPRLTISTYKSELNHTISSSRQSQVVDLFIKKLASTGNDRPPLTINILVGGRYKMVQKIGAGAYGNVYKARDTIGDSFRAVKVMRAQDTGKSVLKREIRINMQLFSIDPESAAKYVVQLHHALTSNNHLFLVYDLLGPSIATVLVQNQKRGFSLQQTREISFQLISGINFLHQNKLAHHDIKPDNVAFISPKHEYNDVLGIDEMQSTAIRILDFGSATFESDKEYKVATTQQYRSPELGKAYNYGIPNSVWSPSSDVWSTACTMYEIFTGEILFQCEDEVEKCFQYEALFGKIPIQFGLLSKLNCFNTKGRLKYDASTKSAQLSVKKSLKSIASIFESLVPNSSHFFDLLTQMLAIDAEDRPSAAEFLKHPFWTMELPKITESSHDNSSL